VLKSLFLYFNNYQLMPYDRVSKMFEDIFGLKVNVGTIYNKNVQIYKKLNEFESVLKE